MRSKGIVLSLFFLSMIACESPEQVKFERYRVAGERLYQEKCSNCHQDQGQGFQKLYPPINQIVDSSRLSKIICIVKNGNQDTVRIDGVVYTLPMPNLGLSDLEVAEITTYIANSWGNQLGIVEVSSVRRTLRSCD